ncbi:MAG: indolepyruvate ferredoxin oxidoreductase [Phycisphaerae bacterium]|nr:indolepyruvate ferredoxin oxidoreductase [Phycisphaerae bacterium]
MAELLLGDEAVGIAALDAGISGMFSYPGTPATEIFEFVARNGTRDGSVAARWSANEKVAFEEALGMSYIGKRSLVAMKHVGLNVAADPFINSALTGAHGAIVLAVADDPGMHSSQNEQDSRFYGDFAQVPMFEPTNQQEAYDMTREAFELSEKLGLPAVIRLVTRLAHSRSNVKRTPPSPPRRELNIVKDARDWTLLPVNARRRFRRLLDMQKSLHEFSANSRYNQLTLAGPKGVIASGIAYNYVREVLAGDTNLSLLKIGAYPIPVGLVRQLVDHCGEILVVEDGYPYIETQLRGLLGIPGKLIRGKRSGQLPLSGELSADLVRVALGMQSLATPDAQIDLPGRPPALCKGCPHCDTFAALVDALGEIAQPLMFSDIGCYTLGALPPYNAVQSCVDMGASISMALGAAKGGAHPVVCTIGDSTFTHSGMTPLLGAAHENANMTVIILDNATVGMTGQQETFATGDDLIRLLKGLGVNENHIVLFEPMRKYHDQTVQMFKREIDYRGLSVIVARRACIQIKRRVAPKRAEPEAEPVSA